MHPLDAINPKISDEDLLRDYGCEITDLVTDNYTVSDVIHDDRIASHKWFTDLLLLIFEGEDCVHKSEPLACPDLAPKVIKRLREELKQTRECLWWCYDLKRFGNEIKDEHWDFIGRLLGADTDHNDNEWEEEE